MSLLATLRGWSRRGRIRLLIGVTVVAFLAAAVWPRHPQDVAYHSFADSRALAHIPHALNVLSNVGFLLAGAWAFFRTARSSLVGWERTASWIFAAGLVLTGLGSAWYHWAPSNATLVWDRLPLSTLFPTVFAVVIADRVSPAAGRALLALLVLGAIASVLYWARFDDLRPYGLAQFLPMLLIPLMLVLFSGRRPTAPLIWGVVIYAVGKVAELSDGRIFALGGVISGHTIKHLLAAAAALLILRWLVAGPADHARPRREGGPR
jgi:hypothetical protein